VTPFSTQNLKTMGLWALILIWCSTFSILVNVGLRLTLGFLTISPSRVSPFNHIGTLPLQRKHPQPRGLSIQGPYCTRLSRFQPSALISLVRFYKEGVSLGEINTNET